MCVLRAISVCVCGGGVQCVYVCYVTFLFFTLILFSQFLFSNLGVDVSGELANPDPSTVADRHRARFDFD